MKLTIRKSDIRLATPIWPLCWAIPSTIVSNGPLYQRLVANVPDGLFWASVGFAVASVMWDPFQRDSRVRQLWHWAFDRFAVQMLTVNEPLSASGDLLSVDLVLRFRRRTRGRLSLHVQSCTGMSYAPHEFVALQEDIDEVAGSTKRIEVARLAIQHPGWDHTQSQGWIGGESLVAGSQNIVSIKLDGVFPRQTHRFLVIRPAYQGGETRPGLVVLDSEEDIFDGTRNVRQ